MGLAEVPVITLSGLTEAQKKALRLADNKIALNAGWDTEILKLELAELSLPEIDIDLGLTGFSSGRDRCRTGRADDPDDEVIPAVPESPRVQPGDIWQLGEHRIGCGDGRDVASSSRLVGEGAQIDCAFLDPPYNVKINGHANAKGRHREFAMASGEMSETEFRTFLTDTLGACAKVSRDGAVHFVCMDWRHMDDVTASVTDVYDKLLNICVWNKSNAGMGSLYRSKHEMVFVYRVGDAPHTNTVELGKHGRNRTNVWDYASVNSMRGIAPRGPGAASHGQASGDGCRCDLRCHTAGRAGARHLPWLGHQPDRGRARGTSFPRARYRSCLCRCGDDALERDHRQGARAGPPRGQGGCRVSEANKTQFKKGQSGNPKGRPPKQRRPHISAFEIILDKVLMTTRNGKLGEATVEEALQQQTLKDALVGKRMAIRQVLKMIEKREAALSRKNQVSREPITIEPHYSADNANEAMRILNIADRDPSHPNRWKLHRWATQSALDRKKRVNASRGDIEGIRFFTFDSAELALSRDRSK